MDTLVGERHAAETFTDKIRTMDRTIIEINNTFLANDGLKRQFENAILRVNSLVSEVAKLNLTRNEATQAINKLTEFQDDQKQQIIAIKEDVMKSISSTTTRAEYAQQRIEKTKEDVISRLDVFGRRIKDLQDEIASRAEADRITIEDVTRNTRELQGNFSLTDLKVQDCMGVVKHLEDEVISMTRAMEETQQAVAQEMPVLASRLENVSASIDSTRASMFGLSDYIDKFIPLHTYTMISETLFNFLSEGKHRAMMEWDDKQFGRINARISGV